MIILEPRLTQLLIDIIETTEGIQPHITPWDEKKILDTLKDDLLEKAARKTCEHTIRDYIGKKTCCDKCGHTPIGKSFSWQLVEED